MQWLNSLLRHTGFPSLLQPLSDTPSDTPIGSLRLLCRSWFRELVRERRRQILQTFHNISVLMIRFFFLCVTVAGALISASGVQDSISQQTSGVGSTFHESGGSVGRGNEVATFFGINNEEKHAAQSEV